MPKPEDKKKNSELYSNESIFNKSLKSEENEEITTLDRTLTK